MVIPVQEIYRLIFHYFLGENCFISMIRFSSQQFCRLISHLFMFYLQNVIKTTTVASARLKSPGFRDIWTFDLIPFGRKLFTYPDLFFFVLKLSFSLFYLKGNINPYCRKPLSWECIFFFWEEWEGVGVYRVSINCHLAKKLSSYLIWLTETIYLT